MLQRGGANLGEVAVQGSVDRCFPVGLRSQVERHTTAPEQLTAFVRSFASASTRRPDLHHLLFNDAGADEGEAFAALREMFAGIVRSGAFQPPDIDLAIDYAFRGLHAAIVAVAHMSPARRRRAIPRLADLLTVTLSPSR